MSIALESRVPIDELDRKVVALTTSSATSVVLLRILLEIQRGVSPDFGLRPERRSRGRRRRDAHDRRPRAQALSAVVVSARLRPRPAVA
jgi:hypothetical protein